MLALVSALAFFSQSGRCCGASAAHCAFRRFATVAGDWYAWAFTSMGRSSKGRIKIFMSEDKSTGGIGALQMMDFAAHA